MHSYSVVCDKNNRNNSIRGRNICEDVYKESYVCVTKLKNDNKISVNVAGYSVCALLDTGSTISTINWELYNKIKQTTKLVVNICKKQCTLADGSTMNLETIISVPVKIDKITFIADLYVLKVDHISMIIGCDLLKKLSANLNFENEICVMKQPTVKTRNNEFLGIIMNNIENKLTTIKLNPRVEQIHLADSDTSEEQKEQLIRIMNKYEMCFANNLMELGRTSVLEYDIETVPDIKPIRMKPYSCPYKHK